MLPEKFVRYSLLILAACFIVSCSGKSSNAEPEDNEEERVWTVIGPGGGGGVMKPTVSPFNDNLVLTHCDMTGVYVTHNGGKSWKMKNLWNVPDDFEFDPADSNTVYTATRGFLHSEDRGSGISLLLRSYDRGERWTIIYPDVSTAKKPGRLQSTSLLPSQLIEGAVDGTIQKVKVHPDDNSKIYLGMAPLAGYMPADEKPGKKSCTLIMSSDHGADWRKIADIPGEKVLAIFPDKKQERVVVFTEKICRHINETDGTIVQYQLPATDVISIEGGDRREGRLIYLQASFTKNGNGGMYLSEDEGRTWKRINNGLVTVAEKGIYPSFRQGLAVCESDAQVAYISFTMPRQKKGDGNFGPVYSIWKTLNGGVSWEPVLLSTSSEGCLTGNYRQAWLEESYGPGWGGTPINMGVAPNNPDVCYAGDNGRAYKTTDGGKTWEQVYSLKNQDGSWSSTGLDVTTSYGIHFDPFDEDHYFITYTDIGLFHTFNGGESWNHSITGVPESWVNTCYDVEFDPEQEGKLWSVWGNAHDLPRAKMFSPGGFGGYQGGVALSEDGGRTWQKSGTGIPDNSVCTNILLDPTISGPILYVSVFDRGIYRSFDGGNSWQLSNKGLGRNLFAWQLKQNSAGRLFAVFARGTSAGRVVDGAVYYSDDKAETWKQLILPEGVNGPHDILAHPRDARTIYLSCWPRSEEGSDIRGGLLKSTDGGGTWSQVFDERVRVNSASLDPEKPELVYINTFHNAAYRSEDSGSTWSRIEGYRFKWGQQVFPDVNKPGMIFLTTFGGSVFHGPEKGIPGARDDIDNMPEGWW